MKALAVAVFLLRVACLAADASGAAATYRLYRARRTFAPDRGTANPFGKSDVLAVDFLTTGFAKPDGSDIRVFASPAGRPADFQIMRMGSGDRARIAIRMTRGGDEYHVCYGGPKNPTRSPWQPAVGLILETRRFKGGNIGNLARMRQLVAASGPSYGTWYVPNIFHGLNLFGPSDDYVSIYRGWLHVPKAGEYRFATTSDDASYFLVDGRVVSVKPRWGRGPANARFAGKPVPLAAGAHPVEYLHVEGRGAQFCVAAWQPPGGKFHVIPPSAFPGVFTAKQTGLTVAGADVPIDLTFRAAGEVLYERHHLYKVRFRDATADGASAAYSPKWFFGDGTSSDQRHPEHVYFLPGEYTVTFALVRGRAAARIRQRIVVGADWEHQGQRRSDTSAQYYDTVKNYDSRAMKSPDLDAALSFFITMGKDTEVMKAAAALLDRDDAVARQKVYNASVLLGERLRDCKHLPHEALVVFRAAVKREPDAANRAKLIRRIGDTLLYVMGKADAALAEYQTILEQHGALEDNVVRLAQIRVGDAWKSKGDYERSLAAYRKAGGMRTWERTHAVNSVRRGAFSQSIENHVRDKQFGEAQNLLDLWGWEHPTDRIAGEWSLAAARVARAKGDRGAAAREALECAGANKAGPLADQLLLFAGRALLEDGRGAEAARAAQRIQKDYPESGCQEDATLLECEGLLQAKRHRAAAKRAAAAYAAYAREDAAPKFLMIAAEAALALNDKDHGMKLLRLIVREHPRSDEAKKARARLDALGGG